MMLGVPNNLSFELLLVQEHDLINYVLRMLYEKKITVPTRCG